MAEAFFDPARHGVAAAADYDSPYRQQRYDSDQKETTFPKTHVVLGMRDCRQSAGQKNGQHHQDGECADIEDALHRPHCEL